MNTSSSLAAVVAVASNAVAPDATVTPIVAPKTTITDNEVETLTSAYKMLFQVLRTMRANETDTDIGADYLTNADTLGNLLARAHRVQKTLNARKARAEREAFAGKIDAIVQGKLDKRAKALLAYNALDADTRSELPAPCASVSVWVEEIVDSGVLGKGYDIVSATKMLHTMGYMVHVVAVDGRKKDKSVTPPYLTATVGKPIRTTPAAK